MDLLIGHMISSNNEFISVSYVYESQTFSVKGNIFSGTNTGYNIIVCRLFDIPNNATDTIQTQLYGHKL